LYGLITSGLVELEEDLGRLQVERLHKMSPDDLARLVQRGHQVAAQLLAGHERAGELDRVQRLVRAELEAGRGVDAVLDLIRGAEKTISAALGPHQAKA